jgi:hypothetical protein
VFEPEGIEGVDVEYHLFIYFEEIGKSRAGNTKEITLRKLIGNEKDTADSCRTIVLFDVNGN